MATERSLAAIEMKIRLLHALGQRRLGKREEAYAEVEYILRFSASQGCFGMFTEEGRELADPPLLAPIDG